MIDLFNELLTFLKTSSDSKPVDNNKKAITAKSPKLQFTSFENCIAMNGMNNNVEIILNI